MAMLKGMFTKQDQGDGQPLDPKAAVASSKKLAVLSTISKVSKAFSGHGGGKEACTNGFHLGVDEQVAKTSSQLSQPRRAYFDDAASEDEWTPPPPRAYIDDCASDEEEVKRTSVMIAEAAEVAAALQQAGAPNAADEAHAAEAAPVAEVALTDSAIGSATPTVDAEAPSPGVAPSGVELEALTPCSPAVAAATGETDVASPIGDGQALAFSSEFGAPSEAGQQPSEAGASAGESSPPQRSVRPKGKAKAKPLGGKLPARPSPKGKNSGEKDLLLPPDSPLAQASGVSSARGKAKAGSKRTKPKPKAPEAGKGSEG